MDSITIKTGVKRICINGDESRVIEFNPTDVGFAERFYATIKELEAKQAEYQTRSAELDARRDELDENGLPVNLSEGLAFMRETCGYMREKIDYLFGAGTSQTVFGDELNLEMFADFFAGVTPFVQTARSDRLKKYTNAGSRVMK